MTNRLKPVWRINTGNGVPSDAASNPKVLFLCGWLSRGITPAEDWDWLGSGSATSIKAYETNRTKPAKYDRVVCGACCGLGDVIFYELKLDAKLPVVISEVDMKPLRYKDYQTETIRKCPHCNGTGYIMDRLQE